ncbi:MAG: hypothetical protein JNL57_04220 [Bacteroidetes bacterium]|nr:hypothetical protein [Bacteroidota bacterium]
MSDILKYRSINYYGTLLHRILAKKRYVLSSVNDPNFHRIHTYTESQKVVNETISEIREIVRQIPPMEIPYLFTKLKKELKNLHNLQIMNESEYKEFEGVLTPYIEFVDSLNPQDYAVLKPLETKEPVTERIKEFTRPRQRLALYLILTELNATSNKTEWGKFVNFLTGDNPTKAQQFFSNPVGKVVSKDFRREDLQYIRTYFESLGIDSITNKINQMLKDGHE